MTTRTESQNLAHGIVQSHTNGKIVLCIPGTEYQVHLVPTVSLDQIAVRLGKRVKGQIHAEALRLRKANGGGRFIEPIWGEPRIVAGTVLAIDANRNQLLVDLSVPVWITPGNAQEIDSLQVGDLVNCYLKSGATFTPQ